MATTEAGIRASLLREWDHRVATVGEPNPALNFPILPPSVTGLEANIIRPQYGPPVLPQHQDRSSRPDADQESGWRILAVGTEWHSGQGGLSTFNRRLCRALAMSADGPGGGVSVLLPAAFTEEDRNPASANATRSKARREVLDFRILTAPRIRIFEALFSTCDGLFTSYFQKPRP